MPSARILVVGAGVFGLTAALEARRRGHHVRLLDQGPIPHPLAASTDISKVIRMEYGPDETYMALAEEARAGWLRWNEAWRDAGQEPLYHETGVLMTSLDRMAPGGLEYESHRLLEARGHRPERIGGRDLGRRFPAHGSIFADGFFHTCGGYAESGRVIEWLAEQARQEEIDVREHTGVRRLLQDGGRVRGVEDVSGARHQADRILLASGSWTGRLLPELGDAFRRTYHPVWHLRPAEPTGFLPASFPTFTADVARTGFYGFPLHPSAEVVKIGHHGTGVAPPDDGTLTVPAIATHKLREFLRAYLPSLAGAEIVKTRLCPYCDTADEDFWIARDPDRRGLTVASGGSGHGFKFAPILGRIINDLAGIEDRRTRQTVEPFADIARPPIDALERKFRWRPELRLERGLEAARCHEKVL